ncbi:BTB/POZ and MATH domain-containing protein 1-like [Oryza brachyantha]|uniref:BTB/POZ and MATH domain-containing protein 1-like n=1 Tax=Oryza brachyantha TaxID=4533 RepID=UPI001ADB1E72|nr:BTB/POZ and MATH domain-containing protein 1-like [Oryza brachyantha]
MGQCATSPARSAAADGSGDAGEPTATAPPPPPPSSSWSGSTISAKTTSGYHVVKIDGYSRSKGVFRNGEVIRSRAFTVGGHRWRVEYYPNGNTPGCADYISVFLHLDEEAPAVGVHAQHRFRFFNETDAAAAPSPPPSLAAVEVNRFRSYASWGRAKFIRKEELERSKHLKNDSFTIRCDVVVTGEFVAKDMPEAATATTLRNGGFVTVPPSDLHRHIGDLLRTGHGADVMIKVGGKTFAAHRCVLAARSPALGVELFGSTNKKKKKKERRGKAVIRIDGMEARVFEALLRFLYADSLPEMEKNHEASMCWNLLVAADRYSMARLKAVCEEKLCDHVDAGTAVPMLALAEQLPCDGLKKACFGFLREPENLKVAMAGEGFEHLSRSFPSLVRELVAMNLAAR